MPSDLTPIPRCSLCGHDAEPGKPACLDYDPDGDWCKWSDVASAPLLQLYHTLCTSRQSWIARAEAAEAELRLLTVGEIIDEERSASRLGDPSEKVHAVERRLRLEAHGRLEHYEQSGVIPPPPHGAASWLDYLAAHQHIGTRGCWQCEAARWARLERDATRAEVARLRAELEGGRHDQ